MKSTFRSTDRSISAFWSLSLILLLTGWMGQSASISLAADAVKTDPRYAFRTDFANPNLDWYELKPAEFPPHHSDRRIGGELVSADFIHRRGQFRMTKTGELVDFTMPPYGSVNYLLSDAELRDIPLGTFFLFFLNRAPNDPKDSFTRLATMQDQFTMDAGHGFSYRLDEIRLQEGKLLTTKQSPAKNQLDLGKKELFVTDHTRVWRGDKEAKLSDLAVGDQLLYNFTGKTAENPGHCLDIWVGADTQRSATERQRKNHAAFVKFRGLPGWIDGVDGNKLTVTLFTGDPATFKQTYIGDFAVGRDLRVCVANDELRTWNPGVDGERSKLLEIKNGPVDCYGTSGVRMTFSVANMLEGFRKGRVVRIFGPGWPTKDPFYGEGLMNYGFSNLKDSELLELTPKEYPAQYPFRTDYGNENLAWFKPRAGEVPPRFSEHLVLGELTKVNADDRSGQFRADGAGAVVDFTLIDQGPAVAVKYLNVDATLADLPLGTRCRFNMFQDDAGAFTRASLVTDEFSHLSQIAVMYRIEELKLEEGRIYAAVQIPEVKDYNGDMQRPPDIGRVELRINADTRVWKGSRQVKLSDLAVGDALVVNVTGEEPAVPSSCTDIWDGEETCKLAIEQQRIRHRPAKK
ncbi:MAG TPA: hypothetical protein VG326_05955 [Tepidisphaeraceae bacterium]|jgi:hypothetical protein|nr:hypothetical protein [Tepidisphaeraceae bacterium]